MGALDGQGVLSRVAPVAGRVLWSAWPYFWCAAPACEDLARVVSSPWGAAADVRGNVGVSVSVSLV